MLHAPRSAAVDELQIRYDGAHGRHRRRAPLRQFAPGGGLHQPDRPGTQRPPGDGVADTGDVPLVRHDPDQPEAGPPGYGARQIGRLGGGVERGAQGADPYPAAEHPQRRVQLQTDPYHLTAARPGRVDQVELGGVVDHDGDGGGLFGVSGQFREAGAVGRRVGEQHVVETGADQPQGLRQRERHHTREAVLRQHAFQQGPAAQGLAGHPDRLSPRPADQIVRVGVEGVQVDDRERGVQMGGGPVVTGPVGGARSHERSLPDRITAG